MTHIYTPISAHTGALHEQPHDAIRLGFAYAHTSDYRHSVCTLGAIDAPQVIPSGGIRSQDWTAKDGTQHRLMLAGVLRAGVAEWEQA